MAEAFLSSYIKECSFESNQLRFYVNLFKDLKAANILLKTSLESDLKSLELFTKSLSSSSTLFIKELNNLTNSDVNFINLCIDFAEMFDYYNNKIPNDKYLTLNGDILKELEDNNTSLSKMLQYIFDLNNLSLKDLFNSRAKYKGIVNKKDKAYKDFEHSMRKMDDNSTLTDKIVNAYSEYNDILENAKLVLSEVKESEEYMDKCLMNNLINSVCCFVEYFNKMKTIFVLFIKIKREFIEQFYSVITIQLNLLNQYQFNLTEYEQSCLKANDIKHLSIEDMKTIVKTNPELNDINNYLEALITITINRKNIMCLLSQFLSNIFKSYEVFSNESKKKVKLYQFKAQNCPVIESTFITKMLTFLFNLNELYISKHAEFLKLNPLIIPSIDGIIKELVNEENNLTSLNTRLKKEIAIIKANNAKGAFKSDAIDEKFNKFTEEFLSPNISIVLNRFFDLTKALESLKASSIDNISKQIAKIFEFLFDYTKVSETVLTTDFQLEDNAKKVFGKILIESKQNETILQDIIPYSIKFIKKETYSLSQLPDISLIRIEDKAPLNLEMQMPLNINEAQVKELKERSEKKPIKKSLSYKKAELNTRGIVFDLKDNEKIEEQHTKIALIDNLLVIGLVMKLNSHYAYVTPYSQLTHYFDLKSWELTYDDNIIKLNTNNNKSELLIVKDKTTDLFLNTLLKEVEKNQKSNNNEELAKKHKELINVAPNEEMTKRKFKDILTKLTQVNLEEIQKKEILHKHFEKHYVIDQLLTCPVKVNDNEEKELPIPIYLIFNILYNPQYCSKAFPEYNRNFIRSLQNIRNEYDIVYTEPHFNLDKIPLYYTRKGEDTFNSLSKFIIEDINALLNESQKYPLIQEFNYTYFHPIPNPIFMGPKLLQINDTYKLIFVSPTCFIVEIKSQSSGFMLLDSFYTVARYRYDAEYDDNLILCNTKMNVEFTIEFVKDIWFKGKVETNGFAENETYITTFMVPNMVKELEVNGKELYSKYAEDIGKVAAVVVPKKAIDSRSSSFQRPSSRFKQNAIAPVINTYSRSTLYPIMIGAYLVFVLFRNILDKFLGNNSGLYLLLFVIITELVYLSFQLEKLNEKEKEL